MAEMACIPSTSDRWRDSVAGLKEVLLKAASLCPILNTQWRHREEEGESVWQITRHEALQTESNEGLVGSVDNLDHDSHHELSCTLRYDWHSKGMEPKFTWVLSLRQQAWAGLWSNERVHSSVTAPKGKMRYRTKEKWVAISYLTVFFFLLVLHTVVNMRMFQAETVTHKHRASINLSSSLI